MRVKSLAQAVTEVLKENIYEWHTIPELARCLLDRGWKAKNSVRLKDDLNSVLHKLRVRKPPWLEWRHAPKSWSYRYVTKIQPSVCDFCEAGETTLTGIIIRGTTYMVCRDCLCKDYEPLRARTSQASALGW